MTDNNKSVTVRVPATSANLGGGFDCLGIALSLYHTVTARFCDSLIIESNADVPHDGTNLIYRAMNAVFAACGRKDAGVKISSESEIPQASGLGSSASCIVAGVIAANALLGCPLALAQQIELCTELDGHPDNVLPAIVGGVTAAYPTDDGKTGYIRSDVPDGLICAVATPDFPLSTAKARSVLPDTYSRADCVYSLSRAAVTFGALSLGNFDALAAVGDRLHQPYRIPLIGGYADAEKALLAAGAVSCCLSGAGPSIIGFFKSAPAKPTLPSGWTLRVLKPDNRGSQSQIDPVVQAQPDPVVY